MKAKFLSKYGWLLILPLLLSFRAQAHAPLKVTEAGAAIVKVEMKMLDLIEAQELFAQTMKNQNIIFIPGGGDCNPHAFSINGKDLVPRTDISQHAYMLPSPGLLVGKDFFGLCPSEPYVWEAEVYPGQIVTAADYLREDSGPYVYDILDLLPEVFCTWNIWEFQWKLPPNYFLNPALLETCNLSG